MQAPVLVINQNAQRTQGREAQLGNVAAAKAVADVIRTTLGPQSMLKMILDPMGGIVLTNDGNAILREIDVSHPSAKSMIELSRTQDEEVGDGTTSVIILAGEMLSVAEPFLEQNMHPTVLVGAYRNALQDALQVLNEIAITVDMSDRETMLDIVRSTIGTKFVSRYGDMICNLALTAVNRVVDIRPDGKKDVDTKRYAKVEKIPGGLLEDSIVLDGIMLSKDITHPKMRRHIVNPRIVLLDSNLEYKKGESQTNIEVTREEDWAALLKIEEEYIENICKAIIAVKPDLVITEKGISDLAQHFFVKAGISCIRRVRKTDNDRIARAIGATIVHRPEEIKESDVGVGCGLFSVKKIGDEYFTFLTECKAPKACTILLRGASKDVLSEIERNLIDAMAVVKNAVLDPRVVPGGGAAEMAMSQALVKKSKSIEGVQQWPYRAVATALEVIPRTLIDNCGGQSIRVLTALRAKHAATEKGADTTSPGTNNSWWGIDGVKGQIVNVRESRVFDTFAVKSQTLKTAIESAAMLLRVDDIVSGISKKKE
ncbi:unnamed protein product (mitochondrion) [Plasmodiophora brassicae]|uniref:T-complex protein 1 subunit gamma n=1 Tax=Plasmodiophora brassicae TaxID=37360 RepID=A0A0G4IM02_PLABS|nr:hypothetical protein PBRA_004815 [Plasmodiophora brassicae]SPQ93331.1 unnamed protein product [Plasmodiophora brassicae]